MSDGYRRAVEHLHRCTTEHGFLASLVEHNNYRRIWSRDGMVATLAALLTGDEELIACGRQTLETLAASQGPHGEIPSNVDPWTGRISYGGTTGRVDANLWFVIACGRYWRKTGDDRFLERMFEKLERVRFLLGCWEFNTRGLLYIPITGDWADEFVQSGYVLFDQLLYLRAQIESAEMHQHLQESEDHSLREKISRLKHLIRDNYWFDDEAGLPDDVYHEVLYEKGREAAPHSPGRHWLPFFTPTGYGYRFDTLANVMVSLFGVADDEQRETVDEFIHEEVANHEAWLLPAFHPVITPKDKDWADLQMTFSYSFRNQPHEYHNGGLWPMVTGFYVAELARRGKSELAARYLEGLDRANATSSDEQSGGFPEFLHGKKRTPGGTQLLAWSAACGVIGHRAMEGDHLFPLV